MREFEAVEGARGDGTRAEVVFVGAKTFPPVIGGIETHVFEVARRIARKGLAVSVIVPRSKGLPKREEVDGVQVIRVACLRNRYMLKLSAMPGIARQLRARRGAVVHAHDATGGYASALFAARGRLVYTMHGIGFHEQDWPTPFRQGIRMMQKATLRKAARVFCTDERALEVVKSVGRTAEVLSSGIDVTEYDKGRSARPKEYPDGKFTVLFVGRMTAVKGVDVLLKAIELLSPQDRQSARFVFIGDGPLAKDVAEASARIPEIGFLGTVEHSRIRPYFLHADAFVLPSRSEGLPISLLEAMASGLPCVASKVGGVGSAFGPDVLRLVNPDDPKGLSEALAGLIKNRADAGALGDRGRRHVAAKYTWDAVTEKLIGTYLELSRA